MSKLRLSTNLSLLIVLLASAFCRAALPSQQFGDLARSANCVVLAEPVRSISDEEYEFATLAVISGCASSEEAVVVKRRTSESRGEFAKIPYLLFLHHLRGNLYGYAGEPFGALSVTDGIVSTYAFVELPSKMPLDKVIQLIKRERSQARN